MDVGGVDDADVVVVTAIGAGTDVVAGAGADDTGAGCEGAKVGPSGDV